MQVGAGRRREGGTQEALHLRSHEPIEPPGATKPVFWTGKLVFFA